MQIAFFGRRTAHRLLARSLLALLPASASATTVSMVSPQYSPIGDGYSPTFVLSNPPEASSGVRITVSARADLSSSTEKIDVFINNVFAGTLFGPGGNDCAAPPNAEALTLAAATFNAYRLTGAVSITLAPSPSVNPTQCTNPASYAIISVEYESNVDCNNNGIPDSLEPDCNHNGVADACDIRDGTSGDCNSDGVPDECQADCNHNGLADSCDIAAGRSHDCNQDGIPDECQTDCNRNGFADSCDIASGRSRDCNGNGIPDECDIAAGRSMDCNHNGAPDECECRGRPEIDCDMNGVPDSCEPDCNGNGMPDVCDIGDGRSADCDGDGIPDECEADCDRNGRPDDCDIALGIAQDCNGNHIPDACEIASGAAADANHNGIPDDCEPSPVLYASPRLSPFGANHPGVFRVLTPAQAVSDVLLTFFARADLSATNERVDVWMNGSLLGTVFGTGASDCPATPNQATLTVPQALFNALLADGDLVLNMVGTSSVSYLQCNPPPWISVYVQYSAVGGRRGPTILPWLEVNNGTAAELDFAVSGLQIWQNVTDTALITTNPERPQIYTTLRQRVPNVRAIPGLKTVYRVRTRLDSRAAWAMLADDVRAVVQTSGLDLVLLENESAISEYLHARQNINTNEMRACLQQLPSDVRYIWYPSISGRDHVSQDRAEALCQIVEEVLNVRFVDNMYSHPGWLTDPDWLEDHQRLVALAAEPVVPMAFFGEFDHLQYWRYDQAAEMLSYVTQPDAIFYPGGANWVTAAQAISNLLNGQIGGGGAISQPDPPSLGD